MGIKRRCNQVLRIKQEITTGFNILRKNRIHMMDKYFSTDVISVNTQVTSPIPQNHKIPNRLPFLGSLKLLIDKPVKTECFLAYRTIKLQVSKPFLECSQQRKFGICSNTHLHHPPAHYIYGKRPSPGRTSPLCPLPKRPLPF